MRITAGIEGMACGMCEARINEAVRNAFRIKRRQVSSHTKKRTVILPSRNPHLPLYGAGLLYGAMIITMAVAPVIAGR